MTVACGALCGFVLVGTDSFMVFFGISVVDG